MIGDVRFAILDVGFKDGMGLKPQNSDDQLANLDERISRLAGGLGH